jgi:UDP-glucose 4-epimerase
LPLNTRLSTPKETVLVTGAAGFIGSHLVDRLLGEGCLVVGVDNFELGRPENLAHNNGNPRFHFEELDLLNRTNLHKLFRDHSFSMVFHMAANSDISRGCSETDRDLRLTFLTTFEVLDTMRRHNVAEIVFASSSAIYGERDEPLTEHTGPLQPVSLYGAGKLSAEAYIAAFVHGFGLQAWICRFPNVVGERATHGVVYDFIERLRKDSTRLRILGNGEQEKPYLYVRDLVDAIMFIWQKSAEPVNCFNIGVEGATKVTRIAEMVVEEMGLSGVKFDYTGGERGWVGDVPSFQYDTNKLTRLGWHAPRDSSASVRLAIQRMLKASR